MPITRAYAQAAEPGNFFVAGKNKIINGDFGIWQRGTSGTAVFLADRFQYNSVGSDSYTQSRQTFTPGNAIAGYESPFFHRTVITTASAYAQFSTNVEGVRTFAGQTVTLSFWAKADTNTRSFGVNFDQNFGSGGSSGVSIALPSLSLTTDWVRYTASTTLPTISGKTIGTGDNLNVRLVYSGVGTFDTWGFQLEAGAVATPFTTATGTLAGELAACQRYYWKSYNQSVAPGTVNADEGRFINIIGADSSGYPIVTISYPVTMRTAPTITPYTYAGTSGKWQYLVSGGSATEYGATASPIGDTRARITSTPSGVGSNFGVIAWSGHIVASAEL